LAENSVATIHQAELLKAARSVLQDEFAFATRTAANESMAACGVDVLDVIHVLKNCTNITNNYAQWPCAEYHGETQDGIRLCVVAVIHHPEKTVKLLKVWKS
jgi:hypothetical protein